MSTFSKQLEAIKETLLSYTCDKFKEMNIAKLTIVRITYSVMLQAMVDLYGKDTQQKGLAEEYFKSDDFSKHCEIVSIDEDLMRFIIENPTKYLNSIGDYYADDSDLA